MGLFKIHGVSCCGVRIIYWMLRFNARRLQWRSEGEPEGQLTPPHAPKKKIGLEPLSEGCQWHHFKVLPLVKFKIQNSNSLTVPLLVGPG